MTLVIADRRDTERDVKPPAVFGLPDRFEMLNPLTLAKPAENHRLFIAQLRGNDDYDRLTDCFFSTPAKHALGCVIPGSDDAVQVLTNNGVFR